MSDPQLDFAQVLQLQDLVTTRGLEKDEIYLSTLLHACAREVRRAWRVVQMPDSGYLPKSALFHSNGHG